MIPTTKKAMIAALEAEAVHLARLVDAIRWPVPVSPMSNDYRRFMAEQSAKCIKERAILLDQQSVISAELRRWRDGVVASSKGYHVCNPGLPGD